MWSPAGHHDEPILRHVRRAAPLLRSEQTVGETLARFRREGMGDGVAYLYVVDDRERLVGVVPARHLLAAVPEERMANLMLPSVVSVPHTATLLEACEYFVLHRFLAFPVVDDEGRLVGVLDAGVFTDEVLDLAERRQLDDLFEAIGVRVALVRDASPLGGFRFRMPWLLATIAGGTGCALLAGVFEATLAESLVLAFFLTLVLGLSESVAVQSVALTVQALHVVGPSLAWYRRALWRELKTAVMLGVPAGRWSDRTGVAGRRQGRGGDRREHRDDAVRCRLLGHVGAGRAARPAPRSQGGGRTGRPRPDRPRDDPALPRCGHGAAQTRLSGVQ
jgi:magnesium transporter